MDKKIYALKNGEKPKIYMTWLEFFEAIDGRDDVKCKIFTYDPEEEDGGPHSFKQALQAAQEYLDADDEQSGEAYDESTERDWAEPDNDEDIPFAEEAIAEQGEAKTSARDEKRRLSESMQRRKEAWQKQAVKEEEEKRERLLRATLGIREDLHMGTVWLDMLLQLAGDHSFFFLNRKHAGRYNPSYLYTLLLYLILMPQTLLREVYVCKEGEQSRNDEENEEWVREIEPQLCSSAEYIELKQRFDSLGIKKLDLEDIRVRNGQHIAETSFSVEKAIYAKMRTFLMSGMHTLVDLYFELVGNLAYRELLNSMSGAIVNPDLSDEIIAKRQLQQSFGQLMDQTKSVRDSLKSVIVGQDEAIDKFEQAFFHNEKSGNMAGNAGPRCVFLFAGPPGVGKTYMAQNFAKILGRSFRKFDMSSYAGHDSEQELIGIAGFWKGSQAGVLTSYVGSNPDSVLLFDEIEKAHPNVIRQFLQILDEGQCYDRFYDKNVSFRNCIIIMTTNAGKKMYEDAGNENLSKLPDRVVMDGLTKDVNPETKQPYFPPEIVSRMASHTIIMFNHLKAAAIRQVIKKDIEKNLRQNEQSYGFDISEGSDILAATVQYAVGGGGDARNAAQLSGKLIDRELYELFSLAREKSDAEEKENLNRVSWECDFEEGADEIREFYLGEKDCVVPILKDTDKEYTLAVSDKLNVVVVNDTNQFMEKARSANTLFAVIDYAYGLKESEKSMSISDAKTIGRSAFDVLKKENPEIPVFLLKNDNHYLYSESEKRLLLRKGAENFIDEENLVGQLTQAYADICCKNAMEKLSVRHQVLTFSTRKELSSDRTRAKIIFYNLKLEMAIDSEDKDSLISDELRPNKKWSDIYVSLDVKQELEFFIRYLKKPKEYIKAGARAPRGALMFGPPGTGKTSLAKVVASESQVNFLSVGADEFTDGEKVHQIFRVARKYAPAVLFIDEIDAVGMSRNNSGTNPTLNALLTEMDGFKRMDAKPVFVMAATNLKELDAALVRRFDRAFEVSLPDADGRRWLVKRLLLLHPDMFRISEDEIESIVVRSRGLSPANLENIIESALREGIRNGIVITDSLLDEIFEKMNHGERNEENSAEEMKHTAYHEAGHAMIELYYGRFPEYMCVIARSEFNGYVSMENITGHPTKERLLQQICAALGGRAAELEFGYGLTPGATVDLEMATRCAVRMVCTFGMFEEEIGLAVLSEDEYRNDGKARALVNQILKEQLLQARKIVREKKDTVIRLVNAVLESEQKYLTKKDIMEATKGGEI